MKKFFLNQNGFSLVEVTMALLIVGVGLVALLGLFPSGLDAASSSMNDIRASTFANEVFNSYRAIATFAPEEWPAMNAAWWTMNSKFPPPSVQFDNSASDLRPRANIGMTTNLYIKNGLQEYAIRYELEIDSLGEVPDDRRYYMYLKVWPGEFGPTTDADAYKFYTEMYNFGM